MTGAAAARCCVAVLTICMMTPLTGCKLIDQTTFAPSPSKNPALLPGAPAVSEIGKIDPRTPLLSIDAGTPVPAYGGVLRYAVAQAVARDPNVRFDVLVVVPDAGDAAAQAAAVANVQPQATALMHEIGSDGVAASRIGLRAGVDPHVNQSQIRVYVR
jgi:hypothetical protein